MSDAGFDGFCRETVGASGDVAHICAPPALHGAFSFGQLWELWPDSGTDLQRCRKACEVCAQCRYISFSARYQDCSWFSDCNEPRQAIHGTGSYSYVPSHRTWCVRSPDGTLTEPSVKLAMPAFDSPHGGGRRWKHGDSSRSRERNDALRLRFLEIGTSNFETLAEAAPGPGRSVEALKFYQDDLPDRQGIEKVNAAVLGEAQARATASIPFFFIHPGNISEYRLPDWLKGMGQVDAPNARVVKWLKVRRLAHLMQRSQVPTTSYRQLVRDVGELGHLKLDVEGGEPPVLRDVADVCARGGVCPVTIRIEFVHFHRRNSSVLPELRELLRGVGYASRCGDPQFTKGIDCHFVHVRLFWSDSTLRSFDDPLGTYSKKRRGVAQRTESQAGGAPLLSRATTQLPPAPLATASVSPAANASCGATLLRPLSTIAPCVLGATFGCSGKAVMFVAGGCRGVFQCGSLMTRCGYRGQSKDARYECKCGQQRPCWLEQGQSTGRRRYVVCNETAIRSQPPNTSG